MHIPRRDGHDLLHDCHTCDIAARSQIDSRRHRTVFVHSQEVFGRGNGRWALRKELPSDMPMLNGDRLRVVPDDVGLCMVCFRTADRGFDEGHAVNVLGLRGRYAEVLLALLFRGDR